MKVIGLFAGVGGFEKGLARAGHEIISLCENDTAARAVLKEHYPGHTIHEDIRNLENLPKADLVVAGFPCQDLSQAGRLSGLGGENSSLVSEVIRLLSVSKTPRVLLENVPFMLSHKRGLAMKKIITSLEALGYRWAYRTVDTRSFGLPQRRARVFILASLKDDPRATLLQEDSLGQEINNQGSAYGFYWTEGRTGLGWAVDSVPPLKGGSGIGIPSPPGIWFPKEHYIGKPDLRDAERLQGLPENWTQPAETEMGSSRVRWKLIGNAVSVPVSHWIGKRLLSGDIFDPDGSIPFLENISWPQAGWGWKGDRFACPVSAIPVKVPMKPIKEFLKFETTPLSNRATSGFLKRALESRLNFNPDFLKDVAFHADKRGAIERPTANDLKMVS